MVKANTEIRKAIVINGLRYWEVAKEVGIAPTTLTVWLREPMEEKKRVRVLNAIRKATEQKK
ncbi:hypothetical protein [Carnobacterium pleistocenium]|uniref:hypothetical protein n=1 Tax=Carnobacterium pleistocenium TaxID=181073 RepID=UPI000552CA73|nr:hypothetical protein [Carnobacterium pleistocenium]